MIGLLAVVCVALLFVGDVDVPSVVVTATRNAEGEMVSDLRWGRGVGFEWTKLKADCGMYSSGGGTWSEDRKVFTRSIAVLTEGDSPMDRLVAYQLFKELQAGTRFERVVFYPPGSRPADGEALPDLTARVRVCKFETHGKKVLEEEIAADVSVVIEGNGVRPYAFDPLTPPEASVDHNLALDCRATQTGIESAGKRYEGVAKKIADTAARQIELELSFVTKIGPEAGVIPPELMPRYTATPDLAFIKAFDARPILSGTAMMRSNLTTWEVGNVAPGRDLVDEAEAELRGKGWVIYGSEGKGPTRRLRAITNNDSEVVVIQWNRMNGVSFSGVPVEGRWAVSYEKRMSVPEIQAALKTWLARNPSEKDLVLFKNFWGFEQEMFEGYFAKNAPRSVQGVLFQARAEIGRKNNEAARRLLLRADALARLDKPGSETRWEIVKLGKSVGLEEFPK